MKKSFTIGFILLLFNAKSYSQTHIPFYGFELSNYEVGDTLIYHVDYFEYGNLQHWDNLYVILSKTTSVNSIKYLIQYDTFKNHIDATITNDTIYNNKNNILQWQLFKLNRLPIADSTDTAYIKFDTINGLKRLSMLDEESAWWSYGFIAIQNIGLISWGESHEGDPWTVNDYQLTYAHLANYGIYGKFTNPQFDYLGVQELLYDQKVYSIRYSSFGNGSPTLFLSSSQNFPSPTLSIYDLLGRKLKTLPVNAGDNLINLNGLPKGMYLYKVTSDGNALGQGKLMNL